MSVVIPPKHDLRDGKASVDSFAISSSEKAHPTVGLRDNVQRRSNPPGHSKRNPRVRRTWKELDQVGRDPHGQNSAGGIVCWYLREARLVDREDVY